MKTTHITLALLGLVVACSPDDYSLGGAQYTSDELTPPDAYTITINGNNVDLTSKLRGCTPLWITPTGRSQQQQLTVALPFAGDYEVTLGADTRAGAVYGPAYKFNIPQNDFSLLQDPKWFYLADADYKAGDPMPDAATLASGIKKRWYPLDGDYGVGFASAMMFLSPNAKDNTGDDNPDFRPITFGKDNWAPWDPGFVDWIADQSNPYMDSYMEFAMDATYGCTVKMYRAEDGPRGNTTGTESSGKFNLALGDAEHPNISFSDCQALHLKGFDETCANYSNEIAIVEMTPYHLCLATQRTNNEGHWYLLWNFVSEEVRNTAGACIPKGEAQLINTSAPALPDFKTLATDLFTVEANGVTYVGNQQTFTLDTETPYDWTWWNGSAAAGKWQSVVGGKYNATWAPAAGADAVEDMQFVLDRKADGTYAYAVGSVEGTVKIADGKLVFDKDVTFLTASSSTRNVEVTGREFTVLDCQPGESLTIGLPASTDSKGATNSYLTVLLHYKQISTAPAGPTIVPLSDNFSECMWKEGGSIRTKFVSGFGTADGGLFKDATKVKLKKGQTIKVTFRLKAGALDGLTDLKCDLVDNNLNASWDKYDTATTVPVNTGGETTVTLTNTGTSTVDFYSSSCLQLIINYEKAGGTGDIPTDIFESMSCVIE